MAVLKIIRHESQKNGLKPSIATIGNFDGVHLGHQKLIQELVAQGKLLNLVPTVITFEPAPQVFLKPEHAFVRLMSLTEKSALLAKYGIQQIICLRFDVALANTDAATFVAKLATYQIKQIRVGEDFLFGHHREGNFRVLQRLGQQYDINVASTSLLAMGQNQNKISSTAVRQALLEGDMLQVKQLLGRSFSVRARVVRGQQRGLKMGFPTANLAKNSLSPFISGVFLSRILTEQGDYHGLTNVGTRPTVDGKQHVTEVHILDFKDCLYGQKIEIEFLAKLRDEQRFSSVDELIAQIKCDIHMARRYFSNSKLEV